MDDYQGPLWVNPCCKNGTDLRKCNSNNPQIDIAYNKHHESITACLPSKIQVIPYIE